jgi:hypothetical protein
LEFDNVPAHDQCGRWSTSLAFEGWLLICHKGFHPFRQSVANLGHLWLLIAARSGWPSIFWLGWVRIDISGVNEKNIASSAKSVPPNFRSRFAGPEHSKHVVEEEDVIKQHWRFVQDLA